MTDIAKTIAMIRAVGAARVTRTELLDLCDAAERARADMQRLQDDDESECSHWAQRVRELEARIERVLAVAEGRQ